ncbi:hypothetical protein F5Y17DRAFT_419366 [Xylariaceae sp. FL0594]|nr:hypothetical protein F5Y17DRAFT_419366 [Xylariaceae sp. FL0594]
MSHLKYDNREDFKMEQSIKQSNVLSECCAPPMLPNNEGKKDNNTVKADEGGKQAPPSTNQQQQFRLHVGFIDYFQKPNPADDAFVGWRTLTELDDIDHYVWGWVVPDWESERIRIFLPDGAFYVEIRRGGPKGTLFDDGRDPFRPSLPAANRNAANRRRQLERLANALSDGEYLDSFVAMLRREAQDKMAAPPEGYAGFSSSLVAGRPLALVRVGYSLEQPLPTTSRLKAEADQPLTPQLGDVFHVQFGQDSREKSNDGLIAYFRTSSHTGTQGARKLIQELDPGDAFDLSKMYTHFIPSDDDNKASSFPHLEKISASTYETIYVESDGTEAYKTMVGALIEPLVPTHLSAGTLLSPASVQLPALKCERPLKRINAFINAGPVVVWDGPPDYDRDRQLAGGQNDKEVAAGKAQDVPNMPQGEWGWLQPYTAANAKNH